MAASFTRIRLLIENSETSDFAQADSHYVNLTGLTPNNTSVRQKVTAATGGTTIDLAPYTEPISLVIENADSTNFVTAAFTQGSAAVNCTPQILANSVPVTYPDVDQTNDLVLTADTAAVDCYVTILDA